MDKKSLSFINYQLSLISLAPIEAVTPEHEWESLRAGVWDVLA
ncbi:hypothetical protein [Chryseobacterium gleum]|uniref:Uncharacterized protein n=1 Tax=Chryseobacterium gleum ATCC 35910 TaxID=525257 RepID=A0ABP2IR22_CHRGE|nr:hypothetical protein [Chryseobacterium gleum]EFK33790.1 hypothetical protein HMPREF0204_12859 [Chryseobacterium gleum ATCC 35910]